MNVIIPNSFKVKLLTFDVNTRQAVLEFVAHVETHGLQNVKGRNKSSAPINPRTKRQRATFPTPKNIAFGTIILAFLNILAMKAIKHQNMFCIIKGLMMGLCCWGLIRTRLLYCQAWNDFCSLQQPNSP